MQMTHKTNVTLYPAPGGAPLCGDYSVTVDGAPVDVYSFPTSHGTPAFFAYCDIRGSVPVVVTSHFLPERDICTMSAHPLSLGISAEREGNRIAFRVEKPCSVSILVNGDYRNRPLHLFLNPPAEPPPEDAIVLEPGMHKCSYDDPIELTDGQTLYIAGGAWVEAVIRAKDAKDIRIMGRGVLSQSVPEGRDYSGNANVAPPGIALAGCRDVTLSGIIETRAVGGWCSLVSNCDRVTVRNFHVAASVIPSTDGFNPCNSRDVLVEDSFFHTSDDCIAIKGNTGESVVTHPHIPPATQSPVENITIRGCTFWNDRNNVVVIGAETRARHIKNITIEDCDVLFHNQYFRDLGAFSITPLHATEIRNVIYDNIRVEHIENQLFCFRFTDEMYGIPGDQSFPGVIADVTIRNVVVLHQAGGPRSEFTGWSNDKPVQDIAIEGIRYGDKVVEDMAGMGLRCNEHVTGVGCKATDAQKRKRT